jgi:hypothetical protein
MYFIVREMQVVRRGHQSETLRPPLKEGVNKGIKGL